MKTISKVVDIAVVSVLCGLPAVAVANPTAFPSHYTVTELHSSSVSNGGLSSGSFAAAAMMGAQGFNNNPPPTGWESLITTACANASGSQGTIWPAGCNPAGMYQALQTYSNNDWIQEVYDQTDEASALNTQLTALQTQSLRSPVVVPIFGQADHWVTIWKITATNTNGTWSINQVFYYDAGNPNDTDSNGNGYATGPQIYSAGIWKSNYFKVITAINQSCDVNGCSSDPYYNKYVLLWEPPPGFSHREKAEYLRSPGVASAKEMSPRKAGALLKRSLKAAGLDSDAQVWNVIENGTAGEGMLVNGVHPDGSAWGYYLVPIYSAPGTVSALAQLSASDGAFDGLQILTTPAKFAPVDREEAHASALDLLEEGETLAGGVLRWDPREGGEIAKSPMRPYYEFEIMRAGTSVGKARMTIDKKMLVRK